MRRLALRPAASRYIPLRPAASRCVPLRPAEVRYITLRRSASESGRGKEAAWPRLVVGFLLLLRPQGRFA
ncbi:MAG: hypothetical protein NT107_03450, partial [Planctomycetota bacterium]|nr:hypothetical protein [Planctomycetota bacterium]